MLPMEYSMLLLDIKNILKKNKVLSKLCLSIALEKEEGESKKNAK